MDSHDNDPHGISHKANKILYLVLIALVFIAWRCWHLAVIQYDEKLEESQRPQRKVIMEPSKRSTIRDRFNIPLAVNQISYRAAILYSDLRSIPTIGWEKDAQGKKTKKFLRREYITNLATLLAKEIHLDAHRLEDLIHSKAAFYSHLPYVIKEDLSEAEYYRLKMLEKDWTGIHVQKIPKRNYPQGAVGGDIIGYMGAITKEEYEKILGETKALEEFISNIDAGEHTDLPSGIDSYEQALHRLQDLQEMAYTIHDYVGKSGIEGRFEQELRGFQGRKSFFSDAKGNPLNKLPNTREPLAGKRLLLSISSELQEYCEQLLMVNEDIREARLSRPDPKKSSLSPREPWIKGGAVVVMDPNTGEILSLASYPRINPNDYILSGQADILRNQKANISKSFENDVHLGDIWDQQKPFERERYDAETNSFYQESVWITWNTFLDLILTAESPLRLAIEKIGTINQSVALQKNFEKQGEKGLNFPDLTTPYEKLLVLDLARLAVNDELFNDDLLKKVGNQSLSTYHDVSGAFVVLQKAVKQLTKEIYHDVIFTQWREENEKEYLKQKRLEEKTAKKYPKPYLDYIDAEENRQFDTFWKEKQGACFALFLTGKCAGIDLRPEYVEFLQKWHQELSEGAHQALFWYKPFKILQEAVQKWDPSTISAYLKTLRGYSELNRPLIGTYRHLRNGKGPALEKHLASAFYPPYGFGYGRSYGYRQASTQGSIFKIVTAYATLLKTYPTNPTKKITYKDLNPLEIVDQVYRIGNTVHVGFTAEGKPIPQLYKGGRVPRSSTYNLGKMHLLRAIEHSSNPYFSLLAGEVLEDPEELLDAAKRFCYGVKTGIDLSAEISGQLPKDLQTNKTGLYATAIGQHTLVVTPLQTAVMLSALANGGKVLKPQIVCLKASKLPQRDALIVQEAVNKVEPELKWTLYLPDPIRRVLLEGMRRVVHKTIHDSLWNLSKLYKNYPEAISDYLELKNYMVGKTSTAESMERLDLDPQRGVGLYKHVWFGGILFPHEIIPRDLESFLTKDEFGHPELVVVVYLRFGAYGKEAGPVAAQIAKKWREIKQKHN